MICLNFAHEKYLLHTEQSFFVRVFQRNTGEGRKMYGAANIEQSLLFKNNKL